MKKYVRRYSTKYRYNQMGLSNETGHFKYLDVNICAGCAVATACQSLLEARGYNAIGEYALGIYERAKEEIGSKKTTGLRIYPAVVEAINTFNEEQRDIELTLTKLSPNSKSVRDHLLNNGTAVAGFRWYEGMMYPTPIIPPNTPWYRRLWYHLRAPRYAMVVGANEGYHAVAVMGVDDNKQAFVIQNSYGTGYGNKGNVYMTYDDFDASCVQSYGFDTKEL
tara:strand:+ start:60566 stop:61231 length:666 start_codon:yes stop_codon:yes gene_type:complete